MSTEIALVCIVIVLYAIPVFVPTWKWFWLSSVIIGLPIFAVWTQHLYITSLPEHTGTPGDGLGIAIMLMVTFPFLAGMFSRYVLWVIQLKLQELKSRKRAKNKKES